MFKINGKIIFDPIKITKKHHKQDWKVNAICLINDDICNYYNWFINKRFNLLLNKPLRGSHITIISDRIINELYYNQAKELFNNKELTFEYDPTQIRTNGEHWWFNVICKDVEYIRQIAGLTPMPYFKLHLTIGHANDKNINHSKYIHRQILKFNI